MNEAIQKVEAQFMILNYENGVPLLRNDGMLRDSMLNLKLWNDGNGYEYIVFVVLTLIIKFSIVENYSFTFSKSMIS